MGSEELADKLFAGVVAETDQRLEETQDWWNKIPGPIRVAMMAYFERISRRTDKDGPMTISADKAKTVFDLAFITCVELERRRIERKGE